MKRGLYELLVNEIKRSDFALAVAYFFTTTAFFLLLLLWGGLAPLSNSMNQLIVVRNSLKNKDIDIFVVSPEFDYARSEMDTSLKCVADAFKKSNKKVAVLAPADLVVWEKAASQSSLLKQIETIISDTGDYANIEIFLLYRIPEDYKNISKIERIIEHSRLRNNFVFWNIEKADADTFTPLFVKSERYPPSPIKFASPRGLHGIWLFNRLRKFWNMKSPPNMEFLELIPTNLKYLPFRLIDIEDMETLRKTIENSSDRIAVVFYPEVGDFPVILGPRNTFKLSEIIALSIWDFFHPIKITALPFWADLLALLFFSTFFFLRKKFNNLKFALLLMLLTAAGFFLYTNRITIVHSTIYYTPFIMELGLSIWLGYFAVLAFESYLFERAIDLIKNFVASSKSFGYLSTDFSQAFFKALDELIPPLVALKIEDLRFWGLIKKEKIYASEEITQEKFGELLQHSIKRKLGFFSTAKLTVYFRNEYPFTEFELNFIEKIWKSNFLIPPIVEKLYSENVLKTNIYNVYKAEAYIQSFVYESIGFRYLLEKMEQGAAIFCCSGVLIYNNEKFFELLGISREDIENRRKTAPFGLSIFDLLSNTFLESYLVHIRNTILLREGNNYQDGSSKNGDLKNIRDPENDRYYNIYFERLIPPQKAQSDVLMFMMIIQDVTEIYRKYKDERQFRKMTFPLIVHEFNNILASAITSIELLKMTLGKRGDEKVKHSIGKIERAFLLIRENIDKFKWYAQIYHRREEALAEVNLKDVIDRAVETVELIYSGRAARWSKSTITVDIPDDLCVITYEIQLQTIIKNLIENAFKYSKSKVWVNARRLDGAIELNIEDDGPGIPKDKIARIWEAFERLNIDDDRGKVPGLGLGLYIVNTLYKKYFEGDVELKVGRSEKLGGARFTLVFKRLCDGGRPIHGEGPNQTQHRDKA